MDYPWYGGFHKTYQFLRHIIRSTGCPDSVALDSYFDSPCCRHMIDSEDYSDDDEADVSSRCRKAVDRSQDERPGLYCSLICMLLSAASYSRGIDPQELYHAGRGSELFSDLHSYVVVFCHDDFDELYEDLEPQLLELLSDSGDASAFRRAGDSL